MNNPKKVFNFLKSKVHIWRFAMIAWRKTRE
jgi:hypothetical protein